MPRMSTQKDVVSAVSAESALLKAAAMIPMVKKTTIVCPNTPEVQNIGRMSSPEAGRAMPSCPASVMSRMPSERKRKLIGVKAKP